MPLFKNVLSAGVTTEISVLTATTATTLIGMTVANTTAAQITVDVKLTSGATTVFLVKAAVVPVGSSMVPVGGEQKVVLETGDILKVTASGLADVLTSYLEI